VARQITRQRPQSRAKGRRSMVQPALSRRCLLGASLALPGLARAQSDAGDWPRQVVRYINLYAAGGANDILSRSSARR
jgi:tripartite-type tricarboxylate transporter receptor subunit TctC